MSIIDVEHLTKTYTTYKRSTGLGAVIKSLFHREKIRVDAVADISFQIEKGEICGILGPNGAGKSTTIKMLCGALFPTSGNIRVCGCVPAKERKKYVFKIGAVFGQKSQLIWDIPPEDSFRMNKAIYGIDDKTYHSRLEELTTLFDVKDIIHKPTRVLSLGERMKCEFIMAMLHDPKVVFLDEPTIGLDVIAKGTIREFIKKKNEEGTTFILTTHDLEDVEQLADRVIIINHGKKVFDDTLQKLRNNLGEKKIIELILNKPFREEEMEGIQVLEKQSPQELTLEVDVSRRHIGDYIKELSEKQDILDISVKELPMDRIIKQIYEE